MNCPVCATEPSVGARACPRCGYQFAAPAEPENRIPWPEYASGAWPSLPGEPISSPSDDAAPKVPAEPVPYEERGFGYQTDSWPQVPAAVPAQRGDYVVPPEAPPVGPDPYRRGQGSRSTLLVGVVVAGVLIAGGVVWKVGFPGAGTPISTSRTTPATTGNVITVAPEPTTTDTATPTPAPAPANTVEYSQLMDIETILTRSANSRTQLHHARQQPCRSVQAAETSLRRVVTQRQQQIDAANALDVSQVPGGGDLQAGLVSMLTYSLQADRSYDQGDREVIRYGCNAGDSDFQQGDDTSRDQAQPAKQQFFDLWSPLAAAYGITPVHSTADV